MKKTLKYFCTVLFIFSTVLNAQDQKKSWKKIVENKDETWFATAEAQEIAQNVLLYQRNTGGWPKNIEMQEKVSPSKKSELETLKTEAKGSTIDNGATTQEMLYLAKMYKAQPHPKYQEAFEKGLLYLIASQYPNGGWPQYFPLKEGYYTHITYNDNAMVNVLNLLKSVKDRQGIFASIPVSEFIIKMSENSFNKGIDCILKTQYKQNGVLTAWCAQHDENTLEPAKARAFELPSLSGKESAKITLLLMSIEHPSKEIITAVESAKNWFEKTKIIGISLEKKSTGKGDETDLIVVENIDAEPLWARFMELDNNQPFFTDRTGKKKNTVAEISFERRNGYAWYTNEPKEVLKKYDKWKSSL